MIGTNLFTACIAALALASVAGGASAQTRPADRADQLLSDAPEVVPQPMNDGEAYHRADDAEQNPAEVRTTRALNDEIASRNQLAENQERAERAEYERTVAQATRDQLAYEEVLRQSQAAQRQWEADRARWEADSRACLAGDRSRCAPPSY